MALNPVRHLGTRVRSVGAVRRFSGFPLTGRWVRAIDAIPCEQIFATSRKCSDVAFTQAKSRTLTLLSVLSVIAVAKVTIWPE